MSSRKVPIPRVVQRLKKIRPTCVKDLRDAGMRLRLLGVGAFREGYKVRNSDVVVKFPKEDETDDGRKHSLTEIKRLRRLREAGTIEQFLPEVLYFDKNTGVIAMRYYPEFFSFEHQADAMGKMIETLIFRISRVRCKDIHTENVRKNRSNNGAIIIDLGF